MDDDALERRKRVTEDAADWWIRLKGEDLPRQEREQFIDWLRESPIHVAEMLRIAQVENALEQFQGWTRIATDDARDDNVIELPAGALEGEASRTFFRGEFGDTSPAAPPGRNRRLRFWSIAASAAVIVFSGAWFVATLGVIETERGERREVTLSDGSVVHISPETQIRVKLDDRERRIALDRGAALFKVAKDPARPFIVTADDTNVRAVGTAFGVEHRMQAIIVTVAEGRVQIATGGAAPTPAAAGTDSAVPLLLAAGEQIAVPPARAREETAGPRISAAHVRKVDTGRELAWAEGRLVFDGRPVADVVAEFNRYNHIQLSVTDPALAQRPVSGVFDASDPESFVAFIQTVAPVHVTRDDGKEIILAAP